MAEPVKKMPTIAKDRSFCILQPLCEAYEKSPAHFEAGLGGDQEAGLGQVRWPGGSEQV
jgi:hypothetical protein